MAGLFEKTIIPLYADIVYIVDSFKGGMNTKSGRAFVGRDTLFSMRKDQCTLLQNLDRLESGMCQTRQGTEKLNASAIAPSVGNDDILSLFEYRQRSGSTYLLCNAGNGVYSYNLLTGSWDLVHTLTAPNERVLWAQFNDVAIGISANNAPFQFNGATATALTVGGVAVGSGGTAIMAYRGHLYIGRALTMYFCALYNQNDWTAANDAGNVPIPSIGGSKCLGMFPFWSRAIVATDTEVFSLMGTSPTVGSADFFRFELENLEYGHEGAANSMFSAGNDLIYFDKKGVHRLYVTDSQEQIGDIKEDYASGAIEPSWLYLDNANMPNRMAFNIQSKSQFVIMCSNNSPANQFAYVGDYYHKDPAGNPTWAEYFPFAYGCGLETKRFFGKRQVVLGGYDGHVYKMTDVVTDNGSAIFVRLQYLTDLDEPHVEKLWRYCMPFISPPNALQGTQRYLGNDWVLGTDPLGDMSPFLLRMNYDFGHDVFQQTVGLGLPPGTETMGVDWTLAFSAMGAADFITPRVSITGTGRRAQITMEYNGAYRIGIGGMVFIASCRRIIQ